MSNEEEVRAAWNVLKRAGQLPIPQDPEGTYYNPGQILAVNISEPDGRGWADVRIDLVGSNQSKVLTFFSSQGGQEAAQAFVDTLLMHWALGR